MFVIFCSTFILEILFEFVPYSYGGEVEWIVLPSGDPVYLAYIEPPPTQLAKLVQPIHWSYTLASRVDNEPQTFRNI